MPVSDFAKQKLEDIVGDAILARDSPDEKVLGETILKIQALVQDLRHGETWTS